MTDRGRVSRSGAGRGGGGGGGGVPPRGGPAGRQARWSGNPWKRPQTDAEWMLARQRTRSLLRLGGMLLLALLALLAWTPDMIVTTLAAATAGGPPLLRAAGAGVAAAVPWVRIGMALLLTVIGADLLRGGVLLARQRRRRAARRLHTWDAAFPAAPAAAWSPLTGVDLLIGLAPLLPAHAVTRGDEPTLALVIESGSDGRARLRVRTPGGDDWRAAVRHEIEGRTPGATVRPAADDLAAALQQAGAVAWVDLVPARPAGHPLRDLGRFQSDPLGPLAAAVRVTAPVIYAGYDILVRGADVRADQAWREALRTQVARIQARLTPGDLAAHDALLQQAEGWAFEVTVRCVAAAVTEEAAVRQVQALAQALGQFAAESGGAVQRLAPPPLDALAQGRRRCWTAPTGRAAADAAESAARAAAPARAAAWTAPAGLALLVTALGVGSGGPAALAAAAALLIGGAALTLARAGGGWSRAARRRLALQDLTAHAPRPVWPGLPWPLLPLPGKRRSLLSAIDLAALWHPPNAALEPLIALRPVRYLPPPARVFLPPDEAAAALAGRLAPPPTDPRDLGRRRLALAHADHPDGADGLVGPTLRDLRKGMEVLGPMGAGKSSFIEVLAFELARIGAGCIIIDAKGDLADRIVAALPPETHERVILIDLTAPSVPCLNPLDRRLAGDGVSPAQLVGQVETLFARMSPEVWRESAGMQQFARMGLRALLEGEPTPTLLHLDRFYVSSAYRAEVLRRVSNPLVRDFWLVEYPAMDQRVRVSIESFRRRLQHFITDPVVQQLFCQPHATLYLPDAMDARRILIFKLVPEILSESLAAILATALFATLSTATFARQTRQPNPDLRWDCPLIIDEVQKFIDAEHPNDAEVFFTQTRSLGVGIIGAHQGLYQYSEAVRAAALQALGGLVILGPIKQDARALVEAYADTGLTEADFAAVRARQEALLRFPVGDVESGLFSARPRERPPARSGDGAAGDAPPDAPYRRARPADVDPQADELLRRAWTTAARGGLHHGPAAAAVQTLALLAQEVGVATAAAWAPALAEALAQRAAAYRAAMADALDADPQQIPDARIRLRERSMLRYGVDPVIAALRTHALALRWPADGEALAPARPRPSAPRGAGGRP